MFLGIDTSDFDQSTSQELSLDQYNTEEHDEVRTSSRNDQMPGENQGENGIGRLERGSSGIKMDRPIDQGASVLIPCVVLREIIKKLNFFTEYIL